MTAEKAIESKASVTDKNVTDEGDSAYEEMLVGTKEEKKEVKEETKVKEVEEPTEQAERSRLGRKVAGLEDTIKSINEKLDAILSTPQQTAPRQERTVEAEDEAPEFISTKDDAYRAYRSFQKREQMERSKYTDAFLKKLGILASQNTELHSNIIDEMKTEGSPFNVKYSDNGDLDAELNYAKAKAAVLSKKTAPVRPNVRGEKSEVSTNISVSTKEQPSTSEEPQLDDFAKDFVKSIGMKDESVKEALKGETPIRLAGRK